MIKEQISDKKFEILIDSIIKEIKDQEELNDEIPNDEEIIEIINKVLEKENFKEFQGKLNSIIHHISEISKYKLKPLNKSTKIIKLYIHSEFLLKEMNKKLEVLIPDILNSNTLTGFNDLHGSCQLINLSDILRKAFKFLKLKLNESRCEGIIDSNLIIKDIQHSHKDGASLDLRPPPEYKLIPNSVKFKLEDTEINIFSRENLKLNDIDIFDEIIIEDHSKNVVEESKIIETRFLNFLSYFANLILIEKEIILNMKTGLPIYHIRIEQLRECAEKLKNDNCMKKIYDKLNHDFLLFADSSVDMPKGIVFYGPPRTGKTFTTSKIIEYLKLFQIYDNLAASDFSHPYQGQAEKMVDTIAKRTEVIPWQLCALFIDEIDSLAPSRSNSDTSNSQASLIGQFLTNIDGSKKKSNMLIIGTTNRLEKMDKAFNERMDIKVFLGVPNCEIRKNWILRKFQYYLDTKKNDHLFVLYYEDFVNIVPELVNMTINFTADAMKKSLDQYFSEFFFNSKIRDLFEHNYKLPKDQIVFTFAEEFEKLCIRDDLKLGKYILPKMIQEIPSKFENDPEYSELKGFIDLVKLVYSESNESSFNNDYHVKYYSKPTRRILIDLDTKQHIECQIQVEIKESFILNDAAKNIVKSIQKKSDFDLLTSGFSYVPYSNDKKKFIDLYNKVNESLEDIDKYTKVQNKFLKIKETFMNNFHSTNIINFHKFGGFQNRTEVLKVLLKMGVETNVDSVLLLDFEYFASKSILDEKKMEEELKQSLIEAERYDKSLIIFDLDNLLELTKNYSNQSKDLILSNSLAYELDKNDISFTETIVRPSLMRVIFNTADEFLEKKNNHWLVFISEKTKILLELKERLKWPKTFQENNEIEKIKDLLDEKVCEICNEIFTEKENAKGKCKKHISNKLYMEPELNFKLSLFQKNNETNKINIFSTNEYNEIIESLSTYKFQTVKHLIKNGKASAADYKWICCKKGFYEKGEIPCEHQA